MYVWPSRTLVQMYPPDASGLLTNPYAYYVPAHLRIPLKLAAAATANRMRATALEGFLL